MDKDTEKTEEETKKRKIYKNTENMGRPTVMTDEVIKALLEAFTMDCTNAEACVFAGISTTTLEAYQRNNPDFKRQKELIKNTPNLLNKKIIFNALVEGDKDMAKWRAERKMKDEYSTKLNINQVSKNLHADMPVDATDLEKAKAEWETFLKDRDS